MPLYLLQHPKIPLLWIRLNPNPQYRDLGIMEQVWHVIPHFEALKKFFYNESDLLFLVHH